MMLIYLRIRTISRLNPYSIIMSFLDKPECFYLSVAYYLQVVNPACETIYIYLLNITGTCKICLVNRLARHIGNA